MPSASLSPAALAYLGDAVCELCVRELLVGLGFTSSARLNRFALDFGPGRRHKPKRFAAFFPT